MSRVGLKWKDGFPPYDAAHLAKVNAMRRVASMVGQKEAIPDKGSVLFSTAESAHDEPRSCLNCPFLNPEKGRCMILSETAKIYKFTKGAEDGNPIEYWPVCGYWIYGEPSGKLARLASLDPDDVGLGWVNAPEVGLRHSGTCCGGSAGGDDCDYYEVKGTISKMDSPTGTCRVLKTVVGNLDCCSFWRDDDWVEWRVAQVWLKDKL